MAVSFDLFGTLVSVDRPAVPWDAVASALAQRGVTVPDDWEAAYRTSHREYERGREAPLDEHVRLALQSRGISVADETATDAVCEAFDGPVALRDGAVDALEAAGQRGPVGICSNCSVPGLVERTLDRAGIGAGTDPGPDVVVASVDCGWRKPAEPMFRATADALDVDLSALVHVGDDARTDGGAGRVGARSVVLETVSLPTVARRLREGRL